MRLATLFMLILSAGCTPTPPVVGLATVVDGDTLQIGARKIRLWGVDAPELEQICHGPTGAEQWCGLTARSALAEHVHSKPVTCSGTETDRYDRLVARCEVGGSDIGATLVRRGLAVRYARYAGPTYIIEERAARNERLGIWSGAFTDPAQWRRGHRGTEALPYAGKAAA